MSIFSVILSIVFFITVFFLLPKRTKNTDVIPYRNTLVNGVIDKIYYYDKSYPVVSINGKKVTLQVPTGCSQYLIEGDSVSKLPNSKLLKVYRVINGYMISTVWGYSADGFDARSDGFISSTSRKISEK